MLLTLAWILAIMAGRVDLNEKDEGAYGPPEERYVKKLGMAKVTNCKGDRVRRRGNSITICISEIKLLIETSVWMQLYSKPSLM